MKRIVLIILLVFFMFSDLGIFLFYPYWMLEIWGRVYVWGNLMFMGIITGMSVSGYIQKYL